MTINKLTCYVVACDDCRSSFDEDTADYIVHFDTENDALNFAAENGWVVTTDGRHICNRCWTRRICDQHGHDWSDWMPCCCRGTYQDHHITGCGLIRFCWRDHCGHLDNTTLANLPTTEEPTFPGR